MDGGALVYEALLKLCFERGSQGAILISERAVFRSEAGIADGCVSVRVPPKPRATQLRVGVARQPCEADDRPVACTS
jgi:hypothetical protein